MVDTVRKAEPQRGVAVIKNKAVVLCFRRTQSPSGDLNVKHFALGRTCQHDATDIQVDPRGQCRDRDDDPHRSVSELCENGFSFGQLSERIDVRGCNSASLKLVLQAARMSPIYCEDQCGPIFTQSLPR